MAPDNRIHSGTMSIVRNINFIAIFGNASIEMPIDFKSLNIGYSIDLPLGFYTIGKVDFDWSIDEKIYGDEFKIFPGLGVGFNGIQIGRFKPFIEFDCFYAPTKNVDGDSNFEYIVNLGIVFQIIKHSPDLTHIRIVKEGDRLSGTVASPSTGEPVPGADIWIEQGIDAEPIISTTTDSNGNFSLTLILHPGTYTIHFENETIAATEKKGGFAIGGFNAAKIDSGDSQEQDGDRVSFKVITTYSNKKESALTKADSKKSLNFIKGEDKTTLVRITVPKNSMPKKWHLKGTLVGVPATKVVKFKAGSDLIKTVK